MANAALRSKRFTMATTAVSLRLTIEGMYSDKVTAVIRELISNADDSQRDAGRSDVPIKIHLPTELEPHFSVRDYGTSMTDEKVWNVYTEVFNSDRGSDQYTGGFGLGSKSPFAIGDSFVATAYLDGEARVYVASYDNDGFPELHLVSQTPTDEPDGFEVSVTPPESLRSQFAPKTRQVLRGLTVPPVTNTGLVADQPVLSGDGWSVFETNTYSNYVAVRQGVVIYPTNVYSRIFNQGYELVVDVPIDSVEVATSREAVVLDSDSTELIRTLADEAQAQILELAEATVAYAPTYYAANAEFNRLKGVLTYGESKLSGLRYGGPTGPLVKGWIRTTVDLTNSLTKRNSSTARTLDVEIRPGVEDVTPRFIVDTPGDATPRKRLRIAKYGRDHGNVRVLHDPTPNQVKALLRAYRRDVHLVHVSNLPDVQVNRKPSTRSEGVTGVYRPTAYGSLERYAEDPQPGTYIAAPIEKITLSTRLVTENGALRNVGQDDLGIVFSELRKHFGKPVVLLSKAGMKRLKPKAADMIDAHVDRYVSAKLKGYKAHVRFDAIVDEALYGQKVVETLLGEKAPARVSFYYPFTRLDSIQEAEAEAIAQAEAEVAELIEQFPLVFKSSDDAVVSYINLLKEESK
jgi:hypothetical protein